MAAVETSSGLFGRVRERLFDVVDAFGEWVAFSGATVGWLFRRRPAPGTLVSNLHVIGVRSANVVVLTGLFIGMVLAITMYTQLKQFSITSRMAVSVNFSMITQLGPVLAGAMLAGRVGSAIAAELATMRVTEQVDALQCLGMSPLHYLVAPRLLACAILTPLLTILADFAGIMGAAWISIHYFHIEASHYWKHSYGSVSGWDLTEGLVKPLAFGIAIALIACHRGLRSQGGAEGVGRAATEAFVYSFVAVLVLNFAIAMFLSRLQEIV
jgi:phospholipid/cholesterol/gamma-HCH transport system permease protein